jgi:hypothetical protein
MSNQISEEFTELCVVNLVEARIQPLPNPGNPYQAVRMLEIKSFSNSVVRITQKNNKKTEHYIPAGGTVQMIIKPDEHLPSIETVKDA